MTLAPLLLLAFPALSLWAAVKDLTSYTIPNWISLALVAAFLPAALAAGLDLPTMGLHLAVGFAALLAGMLLFALNWIGGGDAKLMAAGLLWMGPASAPDFLLWTALAGGALTLALLVLRRPQFAPLAAAGPAWIGRLADPAAGVPYGAAIAAGGLAAFASSPVAVSLLTAG